MCGVSELFVAHVSLCCRFCFPTDRPTPPVGPVVFDEVHREFMVISWKPPLDSGGVDLSNYIIEKRDTNRDMWTTVTSATTKTICKVSPDGHMSLLRS